ncbi:hypothetical protein [Ulvibacterium sp.]|uniref:hypothetical protein n=1 Tax=Ulvibacterium sp. TaxID=2665914 RepID=UPI00260B9BEF|nr:hypothetical protein [Ulvibacterium sp.]
MDDFSINRRELIKMGLAASALAMLPIGCVDLSGNKPEQFLKPVGDSGFPINPKLIGELTEKEFDTLASLINYVNEVWQLGCNMEDYRNILRQDLQLKTTIEPSYLSEYRNAISLIDMLMKANNNLVETWATLLFIEFSEPNFESTQLGRARKFVFEELIKHFVPISGSFKSFGLWNYNGFFGGSYLSDESYRKMRTS